VEADPRSPERGQYGFMQSLIREVAYGTLARRDRRARHLAAARYFEALGDDELAGVLASHYLAAHEASADGPEADAVATQARIALKGAAERAANLGAHGQAVAYLDQALAVTTDPLERASLMELAAESDNAGGEGDTAPQRAQDALDAYLAAGDDRSAVRGSVVLARILMDQGRLGDAVAAVEAGLARAQPGSDDDLIAALNANLSRALMRSSEPHKSIDAADRALDIAERTGLEPVIAEAFINKGSSLEQIGRRLEGVALLEKAVEIAHGAGLVDVELRAINNLSVGYIDDVPRRALDTVMEGIGLARKVGQRGMLNWMIGTNAMYRTVVGESWESSRQLVEETLSSQASAYDHARAAAILASLRAFVGDEGDVIAEATHEIGDVNEPQVLAMLEHARSLVALFAGRYADSLRATLKSIEIHPEFTPIVGPYGVRAAARGGDLAGARSAARLVVDYTRAGAVPRTSALTASAIVAAMEGREQEALESFRAAVELARSVGAEFKAAQVALDAITLLPNESLPRQWAPFAREVFEHLGARPYLALLDEAAGLERTEQAQRPPIQVEEATTSTV
jgi:tetratricopeptide (TPR) repeat protein